MRITLIISCLLLMILLTACSFEVRSAKEFSEEEILKKNWHVKAEENNTGKASIYMGAGDLFISSTSENFISADFRFTSTKMEPFYNLENKDEYSVLNIWQGEETKSNIAETEGNGLKISLKDEEEKKNFKVDLDFDVKKPKKDLGFNEWKISLHQSLIQELNVAQGFGKATIDLRKMDLRQADIETGMGKSELYLDGNQTDSLIVNINTGVGSLDIYLPSNINAEIEVNKGIGTFSSGGFKKQDSIYYNPKADENKSPLKIICNIGVGKVKIHHYDSV
ncbi:MAG: LiaF-related protein [Candidatus Cloacimonetes bacterium]|nr:LiaF-related protein [Candidatus Cloacimonadota bacterium]